MMIYRKLDSFVRAKLNNKRPDFVYSQHKKYIRIRCGFDIETTRIGDHAYMYHWQLSWNDDELLLRKWEDFEVLIARINTWLEPKKAYLMIWVANLGHEFSFLCRRFEWRKIFAKESRTPLTATTGRIEFRECLSISGQGGLANLAKNYCTTQKKINDLDYTVIRNSQTELTELEESYCAADVQILSEWADYIFKEFSDKRKDIPLTSTSIVRSDIKAAAEATGQIEQIRAAVNRLYPDRETYNYIMQYLFRGGFTHANCWYVFARWKNTIGVDFKSSYPAVMLQSGLCYYPMSKFIACSCECDGMDITDPKLQTKCMLLVLDIDDIEPLTSHSIESEHKIIRMEDAEIDNGRLRRAKKIRVLINEVDYGVYKRFYKWSHLTVVKALCAVRGHLPNYVTKSLERYYKIKEDLNKRGLGHTIDYKNAKARLNSFYGCMVTRLNFTDWIYDQDTGEWHQEESKKTYDKMIEKQILCPYWGIYITSWARARLLHIVADMDPDKSENNVLYCDTDSIYFDDTPRNRAIIAVWNAKIREYNRSYLQDEFAKIGTFDWIDENDNGSPVTYEFKTLGAKRYIKYHDGIAEITVSGMRKTSYERAICQPFATDHSYPVYETVEDPDGTKRQQRLGYVDIDDLFDYFTDDFLLSCDDSLKLCSKYDTEPAKRGGSDTYSAVVTDSQGHTETMTEKSGVALVPIPFRIRMSEIYLIILQQIFEERRRPCKK